MTDGVARQKQAFQNAYLNETYERWSFHYSSDQLTRYVRDRRLNIAIKYLLSQLQVTLDDIKEWKVLIVCGGVGGEGTFFADKGFQSVTNSDFSANALKLCNRFDPRLKTLELTLKSWTFQPIPMISLWCRRAFIISQGLCWDIRKC
jgi:hypothetical protein